MEDDFFLKKIETTITSTLTTAASTVLGKRTKLKSISQEKVAIFQKKKKLKRN
ncbi:MAG: hypothetical protein Q8M03_05195 [Legionella sp.]|nr:hypothetical protein [Legionella sp.]